VGPDSLELDVMELDTGGVISWSLSILGLREENSFRSLFDLKTQKVVQLTIMLLKKIMGLGI
jgi:hypothetical protein